MRRLDTVNSGLGVDGQETTAVQIDQVASKHVGLAADRRLGPGEGLDFAAHVSHEEIRNVSDVVGFAPDLAVLLVRALETNTVGVQLAESGRPRITPATVGELVPVLCTCNITAVAVAPEDGTHILVAAVETERLSPWQRLYVRVVRVGWWRHCKLLQDHAGGSSKVHGVEVKVKGDTTVQNLAAELRNEILANLTNRHIVVLDRLESFMPVGRHMALGPVCSADERLVGVNGHDTRDNDTAVRNASGATLLRPVDEDLGVVTHLSNDECGASIDLLLEVGDVLIRASLLVTSFRVSGNTNVKVVAILLLDVLDQVPGVPEATLCLYPLLFLSGRVASQCKNVGASSVVGLLQGIINLAAFHIGARKMHACLQAVGCLSDSHNLAGERGETTAGTPCDINEGWTEAVHTVHAVIQVLDTLRGLGWEELEGVCRRVVGAGRQQFLGDVHG